MKYQSSAITIGLDLGDRKHAVCVLDAKTLHPAAITSLFGFQASLMAGGYWALPVPRSLVWARLRSSATSASMTKNPRAG